MKILLLLKELKLYGEFYARGVSSDMIISSLYALIIKPKIYEGKILIIISVVFFFSVLFFTREHMKYIFNFMRN